MAIPAVGTPKLLTSPGFLWIAPVATADPTNTVTAGLFSDAIGAAYLPLGATAEGTDFSYSTSVEPIRVAEFFDPVSYQTTERDGSVAFALASHTLSNYRRALNGGIAALTPTGGAGVELTTFNPPVPGTEVRCKLLWESTDSTYRIAWHQCIQGDRKSVV